MIVIERFSLVESNSRLLWFGITALSDWLKKLAPLLDQSEVKPKPMVIGSQMFSRALRPLQVFASSFDWFTGLYAPFAIGQSDYFGFGFTTS